MHTDSWSFEAGYCKIKTARQKKRLQKEDFDKQLIRLHRLREKLARLKHALPMVPLKEPYQKGWKRTFVLRETVAVCSQADFYRTLLIKINTIDFSSEKTFIVKQKRKKNGKKLYRVKPQCLRSFGQWDWHHPANLLTDSEKIHFHPQECWSRDGKTMSVQYVYNEPWRFQLQISSNIITHVKMLDEALEQSIQLIENRVENYNLNPRMLKLIRGKRWNCNWKFSEKQKYKNPLKNKPLHRILEEVNNDNL